MELPSVETRNSPYMQMFGICGGITKDDYEIVISQHCVSGQDDYFMILSHEVTHWYQYTYMGAEGWEEDRPEEEAQIISRLICSQIKANICVRTVWIQGIDE